MTLALTRLSDVRPETVSWLWPGRIPVGKLVTLDGDPGVGKSTLALSLAATITTGGEWPDGGRCEHDGGVVVMSAEDGLGDTIRPRLDAAGADCTRVHSLDGRMVGECDGTFAMESAALHDVTLLREAITTTDARLVIVDVMMAYLPEGSNAHHDQAMRKVLTPLAKLADETHCTILLLRHPPKGQQAKAIHAGGGSIGIIGAARVGLLAVADPDDEDSRILTVSKNNLAPIPPSLAYRLESETVGDVETSVVRWMGEHHASATELVTRPPEDNSSASVVLALVNGRTKTTAHDVTELYPHIGLDTARRILSRLHLNGKVLRPDRGIYCPVVRLSDLDQNSSSEYPSESDTVSDSVRLSGFTSDMSDCVSDSETTSEQLEQRVSDNRTADADGHTHSSGPGQSSNSRPVGSATIERAGVVDDVTEGVGAETVAADDPGSDSGRVCQAPGCTDVAHVRGLCLYCNKVRDTIDREAPSREAADAVWAKWVVK